MELDDLSSEMRKCTICTDLPLGPKPLFKLSPEVTVLIAGQAPGRKTHHKGLPFDDASGDRLRAWMGVDRSVFYDDPRIGIFPMGLCYPGTGSGGDLPPRPECALAWRNRALPLLPKLELTLVVGRYAVDWHLPDLKSATVTQAVKSWRTSLPSTLVLPHPSPRNNRWLSNNPWFEEDVIPTLQDSISRLVS